METKTQTKPSKASPAASDELTAFERADLEQSTLEQAAQVIDTKQQRGLYSALILQGLIARSGMLPEPNTVASRAVTYADALIARLQA